MTIVYVDGDACPVKQEVIQVASRYSMQVVMVSNQGLRSAIHPNVKNILVGPEFDAADNWIVQTIAENDIAITADIQLAARCLNLNAKALSPTGHIFTPTNIGTALANRELNAYLREAGEIKGMNPSFSKKDRSQFLQSMDRVIQTLIKNRMNI